VRLGFQRADARYTVRIHDEKPRFRTFVILYVKIGKKQQKIPEKKRLAIYCKVWYYKM